MDEIPCEWLLPWDAAYSWITRLLMDVDTVDIVIARGQSIV